MAARVGGDLGGGEGALLLDAADVAGPLQLGAATGVGLRLRHGVPRRGPAPLRRRRQLLGAGTGAPHVGVRALMTVTRRRRRCPPAHVARDREGVAPCTACAPASVDSRPPQSSGAILPLCAPKWPGAAPHVGRRGRYNHCLFDPRQCDWSAPRLNVGEGAARLGYLLSHWRRRPSAASGAARNADGAAAPMLGTFQHAAVSGADAAASSPSDRSAGRRGRSGARGQAARGAAGGAGQGHVVQWSDDRWQPRLALVRELMARGKSFLFVFLFVLFCSMVVGSPRVWFES